MLRHGISFTVQQLTALQPLSGMLDALPTLPEIFQMLRSLILGLSLLPLAACTWVALDKPAEDVLVLPADRLTPGCESRGRVKVSVASKVGVLERHDEEVVDDLHVLARNHAAKQDADTVVARGPVVDGIREYEIFRCTQDGASSEAAPAERKNEKIEVLPYDGGSDGN